MSEGLKLFEALLKGLQGEDRIEAQVVADAFKALEGHIRSGGSQARAHQMYEQALKAGYTLVGRLFLEGKINHVGEVRRPSKEK